MSKPPVRTRFLYILVPVLFALASVVLGILVAVWDGVVCSVWDGPICNVWYSGSSSVLSRVRFNYAATMAYWCINISGASLMVAVVGLGFAAPYYRWVYNLVFTTAVLAALCLLAAAGLITGISVDLVKRLNLLGGDARLDASGMGMAWGTAASALVCALVWPLTARRGTFYRGKGAPSRAEPVPA